MRLRPFILSGLAVTALLALAATAADTRPLSAGGKRGGFSVPVSLLDYAFTTFVIVAVVTVVVTVIVFASEFLRGGLGERKPRPFPARVLRTIVVIAVSVALIGFIVRHLSISHLLPHVKPPPPQDHGLGSGPTPKGGSRPVAFRWDELLVVAALGVLLLLLVYARRPRATGLRESRRAEAVAGAINESLDDLRADADPRRAIVAAYARMERALAATGVPRKPAEAPLEYLERALLSVDASAGAVRRLTELFHRAKFSQHNPNSRMRDDAVEALVAVRDDLRAGGAVAA